MTVRSRLSELHAAAGPRRAFASKLMEGVRTAKRLFDGEERHRRLARLQAAGLVDEIPNGWQLTVAAHHMMFGYILPSNLEFYEHYEQGHWWHQLIRAVESPSTMVDPIGLAISEEVLLTHVVQVVHASAGYDVALLAMFDRGLPRLREELDQLVAGAHAKQDVVMALLEDDRYPGLLREALDRFEADPVSHWRVSTVAAPDGCGPLFVWGIDTFGTPGRLMAYAVSLPPSPALALAAWLRGELRVPGPATSRA